MLAELGEDAAVYAGGTELLLLMKLGLLRPKHLVDVKRIAGFTEIADGDRLTIGAAVTHRAIEQSALVRARCPLVGAVARHVANVRVRNVGTLGGNLSFADPHSDPATLLLTLDASVELRSPRGRREHALPSVDDDADRHRRARHATTACGNRSTGSAPQARATAIRSARRTNTAIISRL